jgi:hypothetical protein
MLNVRAGDRHTHTASSSSRHTDSSSSSSAHCTHSPLAAVVRSKGFAWVAVPPLHCDRLYWYAAVPPRRTLAISATAKESEVL